VKKIEVLTKRCSKNRCRSFTKEL